MPRWWKSYRRKLRLRARRQWYLGRAIRRRGRLTPVADRTGAIGPDSILAFVTQRNEGVRLPYFLDYYRRLGIDHFLFVDNDSDDGSRAYLAAQPDVSLWMTTDSYKASRFGMDWIAWLLFRQAPSRLQLTGLAIGMSGVVAVCSPAELDWTQPGTVKGALFLLLAAVSWALVGTATSRPASISKDTARAETTAGPRPARAAPMRAVVEPASSAIRGS